MGGSRGSTIRRATPSSCGNRPAMPALVRKPAASVAPKINSMATRFRYRKTELGSVYHDGCNLPDYCSDNLAIGPSRPSDLRV